MMICGRARQAPTSSLVDEPQDAVDDPVRRARRGRLYEDRRGPRWWCRCRSSRGDESRALLGRTAPTAARGRRPRGSRNRHGAVEVEEEALDVARRGRAARVLFVGEDEARERAQFARRGLKLVARFAQPRSVRRVDDERAPVAIGKITPPDRAPTRSDRVIIIPCRRGPPSVVLDDAHTTNNKGRRALSTWTARRPGPRRRRGRPRCRTWRC